MAFRADQVGFAGYANDPEATAAALKDGWFLTGDMAYIDADGWFFFVDRAKDIVRRGGENISSLEVEAALADHPAVEEIAVAPRPDPVLGERVTAFIVPRAGMAAPDADELKVFAAGRLAAYKVPDLVIVVSQMPRTQTGKIKKAVLKAQLRAQAGSPARMM